MDEHSLKGIGRVDERLEPAEQDATLPNAAKASVQILAPQLNGLDKSIDDLEDEIIRARAQSEKSRLGNEVPSIENSQAK